jgi:hypothetical protein
MFTQSIALAGALAVQLWTGSLATPLDGQATDACSKVAGQSFVAPADARACLKYVNAPFLMSEFR